MVDPARRCCCPSRSSDRLREPERVEVGREPVGEAPVVGVRRAAGAGGPAGRARGARSRGRPEPARGETRPPAATPGADLRGAQHELPACQRSNLAKDLIPGLEHARPPAGALTRRAGTRRRSAAGIRIGWHDRRRNRVGRAPLRWRESMAKASTSFTCTSCGQASLRWMGRCPGCGEWNTLVEEKAADRQADRRVASAGRALRARRPAARAGRAAQAGRAGRGRGGRGRAPADRQRGARPRAGRRPRAGLGRADRRLARASARAP